MYSATRPDRRPANATEANLNILIAVPVYNEAGNLRSVLENVQAAHPHILVVDDGSTDATPDILRSFPAVRTLRHPVNSGYGSSLIDAFHYAGENGFDWVITMDADGQHEVDSIPDFIAEIETENWDIISGSRYLAARSDDDLPPPERRGINHRITKILNNEFRFEITDAFCGFKAHRTESMLKLNLTEPGYAFPMQFWPRVFEHGLRLREIPVRRIYNDPNRTFGSGLDAADTRLRHYLDVLNTELVRMGRPPVALPNPKPQAKGCCRCA